MHTCKALVLTCIDFRFQQAIEQFLKNAGMEGTADRVAVAGAAKSLVTPEQPRDREFLLQQIEIAANLHHISEVVIMQHEDCGAYGGSSKFDSPASEREYHREVMKDAKQRIQEKFSTLTVTFAYANNPASPRVDTITG